MKILVYALGGGLGHLQRAIAISRRLKKSARVEILTNSPFSAFATNEGLAVTTLSGQKDEIERSALRALEKAKADLIVVDTFPAGPTGELSRFEKTLPPKRCLIHRRLWSYKVPKPWPAFQFIIDCEPAVATAKELSAAEIARSCQCDDICQVGPVLVRSYEELKTREQARKTLGLSHDEKILLVYHHGYQKEVEALFRNCLKAFARVSPKNWRLLLASLRPLVDESLKENHISYWPLVELLLGVDGVITAGGYHSWYEAAMSQKAAIVIPMSRKFDLQLTRVSGATSIVRSPEELEEAIYELCHSQKKVTRAKHDDNSAKAAQHILARMKN